MTVGLFVQPTDHANRNNRARDGGRERGHLVRMQTLERNVAYATVGEERRERGGRARLCILAGDESDENAFVTQAPQHERKRLQ